MSETPGNGRPRDDHPRDGRASLPVSRRGFFSAAGLTALWAAAGSLFSGCRAGAPAGREDDRAATTPCGGRTKNILVLTGSAREGGNSDLLADAFIRGARKSGHTVEIFRCGVNRMQGCLGCGACWSDGSPCVVHDAFDGLWPMLERAELLAVCSPLYCYSLSSHVQAALERMIPYHRKNRPRDLGVREAILLMCGQTWLYKSFDGAAESWRQLTGYLGWRERGRLYATGVHEHGEIAGRRVLKEAERMGREA